MILPFWTRKNFFESFLIDDAQHHRFLYWVKVFETSLFIRLKMTNCEDKMIHHSNLICSGARKAFHKINGILWYSFLKVENVKSRYCKLIFPKLIVMFPEYARICGNMPKSTWMSFVLHVPIVITCLLDIV